MYTRTYINAHVRYSQKYNTSATTLQHARLKINTYVQGHDESTLASHRSRTASNQASYLLPHIKPFHKILDIGCGPGTITCDFANLVPDGSVIGIDASSEVITSAQAEAESRNLKNVTYRVGSAHELPFDDETFDVVHCHAVLVHLAEPAKAVREMRRVCKIEGTLRLENRIGGLLLFFLLMRDLRVGWMGIGI